MKNELNNYRNRINIIDKEISKLLKKRFEVVKKISIYKKENNLKIEDKKREKEVMKNIKVKDNKINIYVRRIYKFILKLSKESQK